MAQPTIQTSFASGEWAPKLRSRVDVQKYRSGASLLRNFYVDWSGGGASTRQGTKFLGKVGAPGARLIDFQPSIGVSYVLEFGQNYIRFFSNGAQILSGGLPYQISSPYNAADLFPTAKTQGLKYVQLGPQMAITHPNYPAYVLTVYAPTNWQLTQLTYGSTIGTPTGVSLTSTLTHAANNWDFGYVVTAVDVNGQESAPSAPVTASSALGSTLKSLSDTANPGTNVIFWTAVSGAVSYNVYKATPVFNATFPPAAPLGFIGNTTSTSFDDPTPGILPDFSQGVPIVQNPFMGSGVDSYTVTGAGTYTAVPIVTVSGGGGTGATATASLGVISATINNHAGGGTFDLVLNAGSPSPTGSAISFIDGVVLTMTSTTFNATGSGLDFYTINSVAILNPGSITGGPTPANPIAPSGCSAAGFFGFGSGGPGLMFQCNFTWGVVSVVPIQFGAGYTSPPAVSFTPGGASATAVLGSASGGNPGVCAFIQDRLVLAAQPQNVQGLNFSQPGSFLNFNTSFPSEADDAISVNIIDGQLNDIRSLKTVPTGLLAMTGKAGWLINAGGGISTQNPLAPENVTAQPQNYNGANYLDPLRISNNLLYCTAEGNYVRELAYNIYMQVFTGTDISILSNHLFFGYSLVDWTWAEEPFKTLWAVRVDGILLSLAYVKDQELMGWAHHDTNGFFKSVCSVTETGAGGAAWNTFDAVYVIVERIINGVTTQCVERMADRTFYWGAEDSWSVDCGLQSAPQVPNAVPVVSGDASVVGNTVTITDTITFPFTPTMATNNWVVRTAGGIFKITGYTSSSQVQATVVRAPILINPYNRNMLTVGGSIYQPISSGQLPHLPNMPIVGVSDGVAFTATTDGVGGFTFPTGTKITAGLQFIPQLTTLPLDLGEPTVQGKRKKITAVTIRVADTLGVAIVTSAPNAAAISPVKDFTIGNINSTTDQLVTDLFSGDGRVIVDPWWSEQAIFSVGQLLPYPATILSVMPEVVVGDTPEQGGRRG